MKIIATAALLAALPAMALAGPVDVSSTRTGQSTSTVTEVAEGHLVLDAHTDYAATEAGGGNPMAGLYGPCFGVVEMMRGVASGGGLCTWTDGTDSALIAWDAASIDPSGALSGTWSMRGGTGKWATASGGGHFVSVTDPATGVATNTITGALSMP